MSTMTLTIQNRLKPGLNLPDFRKWDVIKAHSNGEEGIVIRVRLSKIPSLDTNTVAYTIHPYKRFSKKWRFRLWFMWLKLRVWIGDLYK